MPCQTLPPQRISTRTHAARSVAGRLHVPPPRHSPHAAAPLFCLPFAAHVRYWHDPYSDVSHGCELRPWMAPDVSIFCAPYSDRHTPGFLAGRPSSHGQECHAPSRNPFSHRHTLCRIDGTRRPPDLKLGGVNGDTTPQQVDNLIFVVCGLRIAACDVWHAHTGRCSIWLHEGDLQGAHRSALMTVFSTSVWMGPSFALFARGAESRRFLSLFLSHLRDEVGHRGHRSTHIPLCFPRRLVTVEEYTP